LSCNFILSVFLGMLGDFFIFIKINGCKYSIKDKTELLFKKGGSIHYCPDSPNLNWTSLI
jgi:hypothetical protein